MFWGSLFTKTGKSGKLRVVIMKERAGERTSSTGPGFTAKDFAIFNSVLTGSENETFEQISASFSQQFAKDDYMQLGVPLSVLLYEHSLLEKPWHRLVICHLLSTLCKVDPSALSTNPYLCVLYPLLTNRTDVPPSKTELICPLPQLTPQEQYFVASTLLNKNREVLRKTPQQILDLDVDRLTMPDVGLIQTAYNEQQARLPLTTKCSFKPALRAPLTTDADPNESRLRTMQELLVDNDAPLCKPVKPQFVRLMPPLHSTHNDYIWLGGSDVSWATPIWSTSDVSASDDTTTVSSSSSSTTTEPSNTTASSSRNSASNSPEKQLPTTTSTSAESTSVTTPSSNETPVETGEYDVVSSMRRALTGQLQLHESQWLIDQLKKDGQIVHRVGFTPDKLPKLVEDNPMVAVEVLLFLLPSKQITEYFEVLINMELSVHGMEVVNRLTSMVDVPEEFLNVYVTECIAACENIKDSPFTQNRLVRMVCVFLSSLIRNKLINVQDLFIELQAFCINFSGVKEAAALYQTVQMMAPDRAKFDSAS